MHAYHMSEIERVRVYQWFAAAGAVVDIWLDAVLSNHCRRQSLSARTAASNCARISLGSKCSGKLPGKDLAWLAGSAAPGLPCAGAGFDRRDVVAESDDTITLQEPEEAGLVEASDRHF